MLWKWTQKASFSLFECLQALFKEKLSLRAYLNQPFTFSKADSNVLSCGIDSIPKEA